MDQGVCLIAYGEPAKRLAVQCHAAVRKYHPWPVVIDTGQWLEQPQGYTNMQKSRWSKVNLLQWSPFEYTLYLDVDAQVNADVSVGFELLTEGWDMVIVPSAQQGDNSLWHVLPEERIATFSEYSCSDVLQLQGGVFWVHKCKATEQLFRLWQEEWLRWSQYDQGALLRAMHHSPVRVYLLSRLFNGGALIAHRYGQTRR